MLSHDVYTLMYSMGVIHIIKSCTVWRVRRSRSRKTNQLSAVSNNNTITTGFQTDEWTQYRYRVHEVLYTNLYIQDGADITTDQQMSTLMSIYYVFDNNVYRNIAMY